MREREPADSALTEDEIDWEDLVAGLDRGVEVVAEVLLTDGGPAHALDPQLGLKRVQDLMVNYFHGSLKIRTYKCRSGQVSRTS